jgi:hypothetical protein
MNNCQKHGKKCHNCGKIGNFARDCWSSKKKFKEKDKGKGKWKEKEKEKPEAHIVEEAYPVVEKDKEYYNFNTYDVSNSVAIDDCQISYDWFADLAISSHIVAQREAFTSYIPVFDNDVSGIGGKKTQIAR